MKYHQGGGVLFIPHMAIVDNLNLSVDDSIKVDTAQQKCIE